MLNRLGMMIMFIGMMAADSDSLVIPAVLVTIATALIIAGRRREHEEE